MSYGVAPYAVDFTRLPKDTGAMDGYGLEKALGEDGVRIERTIAGRAMRAHPYAVLGLKESDRRYRIAGALQYATFGDAWGWDAASAVYGFVCDLPGMAESTLAVYQRRLQS